MQQFDSLVNGARPTARQALSSPSDDGPTAAAVPAAASAVQPISSATRRGSAGDAGRNAAAVQPPAPPCPSPCRRCAG